MHSNHIYTEGVFSMMIRSMIAILAGFLFLAEGVCAELTIAKNRISYGKTRINLRNGNPSITDDKEGLLVSFYAHFTTRGKEKWYPFAARPCEPKQLPAENKCWKFVSRIPLNDKEKMEVIQELAITPFNTVDILFRMGKEAGSKDLLEKAVFFSVPLKMLGKNQSFLLNGKEVKVKNETKYGWYSAPVENASFTLFPGVKGREIVLAFPGKAFLSIGTQKNAHVTFRVILPQNPMRMTVTPK